ncbi:hypothetical protein DdX_20735 [Ditylenchus destructor]|uniref:Uncharacterized protein n=1 Tax=Ditylenchus destructor TaxID=166010 RepID=A0AAD4MG47_9BILA|nr:hypothetical protein DdX_20735 [Ditylenchus destructor]
MIRVGLYVRRGLWTLQGRNLTSLLTDPFIYIHFLGLTSQTDVCNLLAAAAVPGRRRLQCGEFVFYLEGYTQKLIKWAKDHVHCVKFRTAVSHSSSSRDKQLLDFFATGSDCTSEIRISHCTFIYALVSKVVLIGLVQKFVELKSSEECKLVESIDGYVSKLTAKAFVSKYEKFFVKEVKSLFGDSTAQVFEFVNVDIRKKLKLTITCYAHRVMMTIINL